MGDTKSTKNHKDFLSGTLSLGALVAISPESNWGYIFLSKTEFINPNIKNLLNSSTLRSFFMLSKWTTSMQAYEVSEKKGANILLILQEAGNYTPKRLNYY